MMRLGLVLEERFARTADGAVFRNSGLGDSDLLGFLEHFDELVIIARVERVGSVPVAGYRIANPRIRFHALPHYIGVGAMLRRGMLIARALDTGLSFVDAVWLNAPGALCLLAWPISRRHRTPCAVQMVGDPEGVFGAAGVGGRGAPLYRLVTVAGCRWICSRAEAVTYVTRKALQTSYPAGAGSVTSWYSNVKLDKNDFRSPSQRTPLLASKIVLFAAGTLETKYKGPDVLVESLSQLVADGRDVYVRWAGDGRRRSEVEALAQKMGVLDRFEVLGLLRRDEILSEMRRCDIYLQPSLTEGLPRAVVEASAQAAPVVATHVGGIPELIDKQWLVPPGNPEALTEAIGRMIDSPAARQSASESNHTTAQLFEHEKLLERRREFLSAFREIADRAAAR